MTQPLPQNKWAKLRILAERVNEECKRFGMKMLKTIVISEKREKNKSN